MTDVLHVVTLLSADGRYGGPQTVARTIAERFGQPLWGGATAADLRPPARPGERRFRAVVPGERYSLLLAPGLWPALWRAAAHRLVHLHAGPELAGLAALVVLALRRAAFVFQPHGMFSYPPGSAKARLVAAVFIPLVRRARFVVALTDAEADRLAAYGLPRSRIRTIPNGVDLASGTPAGDGAGTGAPQVAFVGRLHPRKHPERFTGAAAELRNRGVAARFVMAGADQGALAGARSADPAGVVEYLGALAPADARRLIGRSAVLVVCSEQEPFGIVAIEALAAGTALVLTRSCDIAEEFERAGAAVVTGVQPAAIAAGIERLLTDAVLRAETVRNGQALVRERYAMDVVAGHWERLYGQAATAAPTATPTDAVAPPCRPGEA